jgi:hypothetical protein
MAFRDGPRIVTNGLVLTLNATDRNSYPGSGNTWRDLSGNGYNSTLVNGPTFSSANGGVIILDGNNDFISIPGNTTIYSSNFTWQCFHFTRSANPFDLDGMWWSESAVKNFLMGYRNTALPSIYFRIDTQTQSFQSPSSGTQFNGLGTNAGSIVGRWILTTVVKNGTTFSLYWNDAILMWTVTISSWSIANTSQAIAFGAINSGDYASRFNISNNLMYNRALSTSEITQNYNAQKSRFGL